MGEGRYFRRLGLTYTHYLYKIINKDLLYSTGSSTQYSVITYMGKNLIKDSYMQIYLHLPDVEFDQCKQPILWVYLLRTIRGNCFTS